jgi:phosphoserine aminotransferase
LNKGPGTYAGTKRWTESSSLEQVKEHYNSYKHSDLIIKPVGRAPSIPARKVAQNAYSGLGNDTVGPAGYNPKEDKIRSKQRIADFTSNKISRKVFEPTSFIDNTLPSKD